MPSYVQNGPYRGLSFVGVEVYVNLEVKAIQSAMNAEEPKFEGPESEIEASQATETARRTLAIAVLIRKIDTNALLFSQLRSQFVYASASGAYPATPDQAAVGRNLEDLAALQQAVNDLRLFSPCSA